MTQPPSLTTEWRVQPNKHRAFLGDVFAGLAIVTVIGPIVFVAAVIYMMMTFVVLPSSPPSWG